MKQTSLLFILLLNLSLLIPASGQKAKGGCDKVTVTEILGYPLVYFATGFRDCAADVGADRECCRVVTLGFTQMHPKFWLEKQKDSGDWVEVGSPKVGGTGTAFMGLDPENDHGIYRVRILTPYYNENICKAN